MTIFEKIARSEIPSFKVWENEEFLAFLDINPVAPGHTLVIPKSAVDPIWAMNPDKYQRFLMAAKEVAELLKQKIECARICMAVVGFEVPHAHIHLVPTRSMADFPWPKSSPAKKDELAALAKKIKN